MDTRRVFTTLFLGERGSRLELLGGALALLGVYTIECSRR
jgi:drug/metabolite transporter (DMT)-like permease